VVALLRKGPYGGAAKKVAEFVQAGMIERITAGARHAHSQFQICPRPAWHSMGPFARRSSPISATPGPPWASHIKMWGMDKCPFCKSLGSTFPRVSDDYVINCGKCGRYQASGTLAATDVQISESDLKALQAAIAGKNKEGITPRLNTTNWQTLA
jgi:hypothetical protein